MANTTTKQRWEEQIIFWNLMKQKKTFVRTDEAALEVVSGFIMSAPIAALFSVRNADVANAFLHAVNRNSKKKYEMKVTSSFGTGENTEIFCIFYMESLGIQVHEYTPILADKMTVPVIQWSITRFGKDIKYCQAHCYKDSEKTLLEQLSEDKNLIIAFSMDVWE